MLFTDTALIEMNLQLSHKVTENTNDQILARNLKNSDVSGSDLYSEQISAYVSGNSSIIRQSFFTNDSNVFKNLDFNDPGFFECSVMIVSSNGIKPSMFPAPFSDSIFGSDYLFLYDSFFGFLHYNTSEETSISVIERAERALDILSNSFGMELFLLEHTEDSEFFPFIGYYPNWQTFLEIITVNAPLDGYWGALRKERLSTSSYYDNNHLSSVILMLNSIDYLFEGLNLSEKYFGFDIAKFSFPFFEGSGVTSLFSNTFGLLNASETGFADFDVDSFIEGDSKVLAAMVHYEGKEDSIWAVND
jgi:hypothetical protein